MPSTTLVLCEGRARQCQQQALSATEYWNSCGLPLTQTQKGRVSRDGYVMPRARHGITESQEGRSGQIPSTTLLLPPARGKRPASNSSPASGCCPLLKFFTTSQVEPSGRTPNQQLFWIPKVGGLSKSSEPKSLAADASIRATSVVASIPTMDASSCMMQTQDDLSYTLLEAVCEQRTPELKCKRPKS